MSSVIWGKDRGLITLRVCCYEFPYVCFTSVWGKSQSLIPMTSKEELSSGRGQLNPCQVKQLSDQCFLYIPPLINTRQSFYIPMLTGTTNLYQWIHTWQWTLETLHARGEVSWEKPPGTWHSTWSNSSTIWKMSLSGLVLPALLFSSLVFLSDSLNLISLPSPPAQLAFQVSAG